MPRKPTIKQQRALNNLAENGGNVSKAMRDAGYSLQTAKSPDKLLKSKGVEKLLDKYLPNNHLLKKNREFIDAKRQVRIFKKGDLETEYEETDPSAVKALDLAYKVRRLYDDSPAKLQPITINILNYDGKNREAKVVSATIPSKASRAEETVEQKMDSEQS